MAYTYHLRILGSDRTSDHATFAEASEALAALLTSTDQSWELVRTGDGPDPWTDVLTGVGPSLGTGNTVLHHFHHAG